MSRMFVFVLFFGFEIPASAQTERLIRFVSDHSWEVGQPACLKGVSVVYGCGHIARITPGAVYLQVSLADRSLIRGDRLRVEEAARPSASSRSYSTARPKETKSDLSLSAGLAGATRYLFPEVQFDVAICDYFSIGARAALAPIKKPGVEITVLGGFLVAQLFLGKNRFTGFGLDLAAGAYGFQIRAQSGEERLAIGAAQAAIAWGANLGEGFSAHLRAGVQVFARAESKTVDLGVNGAQPLFGVQIGYAF